MADESRPTRRAVLLEEVFRILDSKQRGFVSKVELAHILDAMQADAKGPMPIPEALLPHKISRDCKVSPQDLTGWLEALSVAELEDVKWFAESVVKVESELREVWLHAVKRWQEAVVQLQSRDLHRYLLSSQPSRVARWLQLRTDTSEPVGLPGLGFSQHEVETLFADETADDINACHEHIQPFLLAVQLREELGQLELSADTAGLASELLAKLVQLASSRDLACLLTHEETLGLATSLVGVDGVPQQVTVEASKLIMTILGHRIHEGCCNLEDKCRQTLQSYLEVAFDPFEVPGSQGGQEGQRQLGTISRWVENLVMQQSDLDRGEMVDKLIKYDEQRLLVAEQESVPESLFSYGRTIHTVLARLDLTSHYSLHERRTPIRTHLLKFLLNVLSSSGDRGRSLFRAGRGMAAICSVLRGDAWGEVRPELPLAVELDQPDHTKKDDVFASTGSWPGLGDEPRYYEADFADNKFYGPKDRVLAAAFLEFLGSEELWGDHLLDELCQSAEVLQVLCRVRPRCVVLLRMMLKHPKFTELLRGTARGLAEKFAERELQPLLCADLSRPSPMPLALTGRALKPEREVTDALKAFWRNFVEVETKNRELRLLAFMYHHLRDPAQPGQGLEGTTCQEDIDEICGLLAEQLPVAHDEVLALCIEVFLSLRAVHAKEQAAGVSRIASIQPECLYLLRLVQLLRLREPRVPDFVADLEAVLQALMPPPLEDQAEAEVIHFHAVPLRRSILQQYPSTTAAELVQSLANLLRDLELTETQAHRATLVTFAFTQLCFYTPLHLAVEASLSTVTTRLGIDLVRLRALQEIMPSQLDEAEAVQEWPHCRLSVHGELLLMEAMLESQVFSFLRLGGSWMLWANSLDAAALTDSSQVRSYFGMQ